MGKIREGRWDCDSCGKKGIRGGQRVCPGCGQPRPQNVKFYLPQGEPEVTDTAQLQQARAGADWYCQHCGAGNSNLRNTCKQCGAAKGSSPSHKVRDYRPPEVPRSGEEKQPRSAPAGRYSTYARQASAFVEPEDRLDWRKYVIPGAVVGGLFLIGLILFLLLRPHVIDVMVTGFSWERAVTIEQYRTVTEEDWSVPSGGREMSHHTEIRTYVQVLDHYDTKTKTVSEQVPDGEETYVCGERDLGNGYFEDVECTRTKYRTETHTETYQEPVYRQDPVYDIKYTYQIERWVFSRKPQSSGDSHKPFWPEFQLASNEREAGRSEQYVVSFTEVEKGKVYSRQCNLEEWSSYEEDERLKIKVNALGIVTEVISK